MILTLRTADTDDITAAAMRYRAILASATGRLLGSATTGRAATESMGYPLSFSTWSSRKNSPSAMNVASALGCVCRSSRATKPSTTTTPATRPTWTP